jgi:CubicO group peptidase (beta-lactamase class C family)
MPRSRRPLTPALLFLVLLPVVTRPARADEKTDAGLAKIAPKMREFVDAKQISGAVTLVVHKGKIVHFEAVGEADIAEHRPMTKDTLFGVASMTKPITATAVMILQDERKLSIDDPVSKYIPQFKDARLAEGRPQREITIRDCLTHTSGLSGDQAVVESLEKTAEELAKRPLKFEPGTKWEYSPGLNVCGRVVAIVSGQSFEDFLAKRIFKPLQMTSSTFDLTAERKKNVALLYKPGEDKQSIVAVDPQLSPSLTPGSGTPAYGPSGGLFSTAADMARFYQMILNGGELDGARILSADAVRQMTSPQTGDLAVGFTPGNCWGLGFCIVREPQEVTKMLSPGSFGHGGAWGTQGWIDPKRQTIYVLLIQRRDFGNSDAADIRGAFQQLAADTLGN